MGESNRVQMSYVKETTWGTTPSSNLQTLRVTGESLAQVTQTKTSNEIRSDRQISKVVRTNLNAGGALNFELSYATLDDFLLAAICSAAWSSAVTVTATTISAAASDNSFNDSGSGFGSLAVGQWIEARGFATSTNNGYFKILTKTSAKITVAGGTLVNESAGSSFSIIMGAQAVNGTQHTSFSIEKKYSDLSSIFAAYRGMMVDQFSLSVPTENMVTASATMLGAAETSETATIGTGYTAATTSDVYNTVDNVFSVLENATRIDANEFTMQIQNNLRQRMILGNLGPKSLGKGSIGVSGTLKMYFDTAAMMARYLAFTSTSVAVSLKDSAGNAYVLDFPAVKFTDGKRVAGGINQDIIADMTWMAFAHATEGITIRIAKFPNP